MSLKSPFVGMCSVAGFVLLASLWTFAAHSKDQKVEARPCEQDELKAGLLEARPAEAQKGRTPPVVVHHEDAKRPDSSVRALVVLSLIVNGQGMPEICAWCAAASHGSRVASHELQPKPNLTAEAQRRGGAAVSWQKTDHESRVASQQQVPRKARDDNAGKASRGSFYNCWSRLFNNDPGKDGGAGRRETVQKFKSNSKLSWYGSENSHSKR